MAKFGYLNTNQQEPRPGRRYATCYYRQSRRERARTMAHITRTIQRVAERADQMDDHATLEQPLRGFRKEAGGYYTALEIMENMVTQMNSGKDIPSGMLGRWNRLFAGSGHEIDMVPEAELPAPTVLDELVEDLS